MGPPVWQAWFRLSKFLASERIDSSNSHRIGHIMVSQLIWFYQHFQVIGSQWFFLELIFLCILLISYYNYNWEFGYSFVNVCMRWVELLRLTFKRSTTWKLCLRTTENGYNFKVDIEESWELKVCIRSKCCKLPKINLT